MGRLTPRPKRPKRARRWRTVTISLDAGVIAAMRGTGPGWRKLPNAILEEWLRTHKPEEIEV
jgi:uncharacterized protein (DUF4415 family)